MTAVQTIAASLAASAVMLLPCLTYAQSTSSPAKTPKPDLHAGGANPSSIPNDAVTVVTLPGLHLTGAHVDAGPTCSVISYQVVSDNEISMKIKGMRTVQDNDDQCTIKVRTPAGTASVWIVVELTDAQQREKDAGQRSADMNKAQAFANRSGKAWHLSFAGGSSETYTSAGATQDGMPTFQNKAGTVVKIAVATDNTVMIIEPGCMRTGKLAGTQVKEGQSQGECTPPGTWAATVEH